MLVTRGSVEKWTLENVFLLIGGPRNIASVAVGFNVSRAKVSKRVFEKKEGKEKKKNNRG